MAEIYADIAKTVYLIHRRKQFRADEATVRNLEKKDNIVLVLDSVVTKLNATARLESIEVSAKDGSSKTLEVDGLFVAVGRIPENESPRTYSDVPP